MNARQKFAAEEQRQELFAAADWRSVVSGEPLRSGVPMLAHRVAKTQNNLTQWGSEVVNHPLNLVPVKDLRENDLCNIGNRRMESNALLERIVRINTGREEMPDMVRYYAELREQFKLSRNP